MSADVLSPAGERPQASTGRHATVAAAPDSHVAARSWEALFRAQVTLMRRFAAEDVWAPLTVREYDVLFTLSRAPEHGLRLHELNEDMLLSQPSLSRMVDRLEAHGLVSRRPSVGDRRGLLIVLTPQGAQLQKSIGRKHVESIRAYVEPALTLEELRTLEHLCTKLRSAQTTIATRTPHTPAQAEERAS
ncbi:MarR family winged helix-turn-helix transcriptional regulator [Sanguibacter antarcticus]|uniref:MarR family transcriptional regulator n=1 Tax=Sanguibacter antarcticus TaxID=372484 RepID=A0A2A9E4Q2_9MICO|nr:MarR family transcriptional regulator [Sanguibacter antarcticus]PFG33170.1 MarR family transcriptional regulator [Sanguibacter antarcticus]